MRSNYSHNGIQWIDLESPTRDEIEKIVEEFGIHPMVAEELLTPSPRPHMEVHSNYLYIILHFPSLRHSHKTAEQEIDFLIGKDFLISAHYDAIDPLHQFSKIFEVNTVLNKAYIGDHAGFLFFYMLRKLYKAVEHEIDHVRSHLRKIEENVFEGHEVRMVESISYSARDLLNLRQTLEPHREALRSLETDGASFFGQDFMPYLRALSNEYYRVHNHVMRNTESLHELRETNNSLLTTKQNETMRVLTIMALLTFPLALFVAILDVDTKYNPIRGLPFDFWIIVTIIAVSGAIMLWYFKHRKWL